MSPRDKAARDLGRDAVGVDLDPDNVAAAERRLDQQILDL